METVQEQAVTTVPRGQPCSKKPLSSIRGWDQKKAFKTNYSLQKILCFHGCRQGDTQVVGGTRATIHPLSPTRVNTMLRTVEMSESALGRRKKNTRKTADTAAEGIEKLNWLRAGHFPQCLELPSNYPVKWALDKQSPSGPSGQFRQEGYSAAGWWLKLSEAGGG